MIKNFTEVMNLFLEQSKDFLSPTGWQRAKDASKPLCNFYCGWSLSNTAGNRIIDGQRVADYRNWRKASGKAVSTIAREVSAASSAVDYAIKEKYWDLHNPFLGRGCPRADRKLMQPRQRFFSSEEINALMNASEGVWRDLIEFYLWTGMRANEALNLTWDRVIGDAAVMEAGDHKGGYRDTRFLFPRAIEILNAQPRARYCFSIKGEKILYHRLWKKWKAIRIKAGVEDARIHDLRHTCADMMRKVFGLEVTQAVLGHKSKQTTEMVYAPRMSADSVRAAVEGASAWEKTFAGFGWGQKLLM